MAFAKRLQRTLKVMVVTSTDTNTPMISLCKKMGNATTYTNKKMDSLQQLQNWLFSKCQDEGPYPLSGEARDQVPASSRDQDPCPLNAEAKVNTCPLIVKTKEHVPSMSKPRNVSPNCQGQRPCPLKDHVFSAPSQGPCPLNANAKDHVTSVPRRRTTTGPTTGK